MATGLVLVAPPAFAVDPVLTWSSQASMPTARYGAAVTTTLDGDIVVFGGVTFVGGPTTGVVERYHPTTNSWASLAPMPTPRNHASAVASNDGTILVVGGFPAAADSTNVVEAYDPIANSWSSRASLPINASGAESVRGPDNTIYVIGGYPGCCFGYLNTVFAYDEVNNSWNSRAPMPTPRENPAAALAGDGKIYVVGGNGSGPTDQVVEVYDPVANTWQSRSPMPLGGSSLSLIAAPNGKLYAFGYDDLGTVLEYDTTADTWTAVESMPTPRRNIAAALAGDGNVYALGGLLSPSFQTTAITERASFTSEPILPVYNIAVNTKAAGANHSITATAGTGAPSGDTVTVAVATGTFPGAVGCSDTKGNTYAVVADKSTGAGRLFVCSSSVTSALEPGDVVSATYPQFSGLSVVSVNGLAAAAAGGVLDQASTNAGNNPNPTSGNVTTTQATEIIFGVITHNSVPTFTPGPGFTVVGAVTGGSGSGTKTLTPEYMSVTSAGTYAATGTLSGGQQWRAAVLTYA